jgi:hypothetical protein
VVDAEVRYDKDTEMVGLEPTSEHIACLEDRNEKLLESNCRAAFIISICRE